MSHSTLLAISLAFSFAAYLPYVHGIGRGEMRPTRPTWLMILITDLLLFGFMLMEARWDWLLLGFTAGNLSVLGAMAWSDLRAARLDGIAPGARFRETALLAVLGRDAWTSKDLYSVGVASTAVALWAISGSGVAAICFSLAGKIAASVPMWINLLRDPAREPILPWAFWTLGGGLYVLAIPASEWSFVSLATPVLFLILECIVLALLMRRFADLPTTAPAHQI